MIQECLCVFGTADATGRNVCVGFALHFLPAVGPEPLLLCRDGNYRTQ
jgi:hypothetical protein